MAGLVALALLGSFLTLVVTLAKHSRYRLHLLGAVGGLSAFLALLCFAIYHIYILDEGLYSAVRQKDYGEVQSLLKRGASPEAAWKDGTPALHQAEEGQDKRMIQILKAAGAKR